MTGQVVPGKTTIMREYSKAYTPESGQTPYYAILEDENKQLYQRYLARREQAHEVPPGGPSRRGTATTTWTAFVASALDLCRTSSSPHTTSKPAAPRMSDLRGARPRPPGHLAWRGTQGENRDYRQDHHLRHSVLQLRGVHGPLHLLDPRGQRLRRGCPDRRRGRRLHEGQHLREGPRVAEPLPEHRRGGSSGERRTWHGRPRRPRARKGPVLQDRRLR